MPDFPPCDDVCGVLDEHLRRFFAGRKVEVFTWPAGPIVEQNPHFRVLRVLHVEFLWLLPITEPERDLKASSGLEALESLFDEAGLKYWQVGRASVI